MAEVVKRVAAAVLLLAGSARAVTIREYVLPPDHLPSHIVAGPDGNMWFTDPEQAAIDRLTPDGTFDSFPTVDACVPYTITLGMDGQLWYTCIGQPAAEIQKMDVNGTATRYPQVHQPNTFSITSGPGGFLWYTNDTTGVTMDLPDATLWDTIPFATGLSTIAVGGDGKAWVAAGSSIHAIDPRTKTYTSIDVSPHRPYYMTWCQAAGGVAWTEDVSNGFVRVATATGDIDVSPVVLPSAITCDDEAAWFALGFSSIGRIGLPGGGFTSFAIPTFDGGVNDLAIGPDGSIWFTEDSAKKVGRLFFRSVPGDVNGDGTVDVADVFYLINFLFAGGPAPQP